MICTQKKKKNKKGGIALLQAKERNWLTQKNKSKEGAHVDENRILKEEQPFIRSRISTF